MWTGWSRRARLFGRSCRWAPPATATAPISRFPPLRATPISWTCRPWCRRVCWTQRPAARRTLAATPGRWITAGSTRAACPLLRQAFRRWQALGGPSEPGYQAFLTRNAPWLEDYALFMALKARQGGAAWDGWPQPLRMRQPEALAAARAELAGEMDFHRFVQYQFEAQWQALKAYANGKGVRIIGDIPIYVAFDSAGHLGPSGAVPAGRRPPPHRGGGGCRRTAFRPPASCGATPFTTGRPTVPPATAGGSTGWPPATSATTWCGSTTSAALTSITGCRQGRPTPAAAPGRRARAKSCSTPCRRLWAGGRSSPRTWAISPTASASWWRTAVSPA